MQIFLHQTHHQIGDFEKIFNDLKSQIIKEDVSERVIHVYPEVYLTGYPLSDLVLQRPFIDKYLKFLEDLKSFALSQSKNECLFLVGGIEFDFDENKLPLKIRNVVFAIEPGKSFQAIYTKRLLPHYDIFDENKYYATGNTPCVYKWNNKNLGILICEDMWFSSTHNIDPSSDMHDYCAQNNIQLDAVINLSGSPFFIGKEAKRIKRAKALSHYFQAPFFYVNRVGAEDEILFDGGSFVQNGDKTLFLGNSFHPDLIKCHFEDLTDQKYIKPTGLETENTWEGLFNPNLDFSITPPIVPHLKDEDSQAILEALQLGIQDYVKKTGFNKFTIALSGGMDSALVLTILKLILKDGQELEAIYMPGFYSAAMSYDLSLELCKNLGVKLTTLPIKFFHSSIKNSFLENFNEELSGLADENIQSRLRGALLYARSNQTGSIVLNTSNKSEIAVGYSTQYGDSVGALSVLGDLYKTEVFELAKYINKKWNNLIPIGIIERPPSAELRENQEDAQSLPPYPVLDGILEGILSYRMGIDELIEKGFCEKDVKKVYGLYEKSEYKRNQFCPIIKLRAKSFGFGYRVPITKARIS